MLHPIKYCLKVILNTFSLWYKTHMIFGEGYGDILSQVHTDVHSTATHDTHAHCCMCTHTQNMHILYADV